MDTSMGAIKFWNGNVIAMGIEVHCDRIAALKAAPTLAIVSASIGSTGTLS